MESGREAPELDAADAGGQSASHSKRTKELENAVLHSGLRSGRADAEPPAAGEAARSLTDRLNQRLLASFLDKLNQSDPTLPGIRRPDCAAEDDSNRAEDDW